jgi:hypothetical protein
MIEQIIITKEKMMSQPEYRIPTYPVVQFLVKNGTLMTFIMAMLPVIAGLYFSVTGSSIWFVVGGIFLGSIVGGLIMSYVEVLKIISDTLMPR